MRRTLPVVLVVAMLVSPVAMARADESSVDDPSGDSQSLRFDIVEARHSHLSKTPERPAFLVHAVRSDEPISNEDLEIRFNFDARGSRRFDKSVVASRDGEGSWVAELYSEASEDPRNRAASAWAAFVGVSQVGDDTIEIRLRRKDLGELSKRWGVGYRWSVEAYNPQTYRGFCEAIPMPGGGHGDATCYDDAAPLKHWLR